LGLVYEHWRPDLNECFYVGASRVGVSRACDFTPRNEKYAAVLTLLMEKGVEPYVKLVWVNLNDEVTGTYEKLRIAYQQALVGKRLTNIGYGGFGFGISREYNREIQKIVQNKPDVNFKRSSSLIKTNKNPEVKQKRSRAAYEAHQRPDVIKRRKELEQTPELREKRKLAAAQGGQAAAKRSPQERRESALRAVETRKLNKIKLRSE